MKIFLITEKLEIHKKTVFSLLFSLISYFFNFLYLYSGTDIY